MNERLNPDSLPRENTLPPEVQRLLRHANFIALEGKLVPSLEASYLLVADDLRSAANALSSSRRREQVLREALDVIHKTVRGDEKSECWTVRKWLDERGVFNDDISGQRRLVEAVCTFALAHPEGRAEPTPPADVASS